MAVMVVGACMSLFKYTYYMCINVSAKRNAPLSTGKKREREKKKRTTTA